MSFGKIRELGLDDEISFGKNQGRTIRSLITGRRDIDSKVTMKPELDYMLWFIESVKGVQVSVQVKNRVFWLLNMKLRIDYGQRTEKVGECS